MTGNRLTKNHILMHMIFWSDNQIIGGFSWIATCMMLDGGTPWCRRGELLVLVSREMGRGDAEDVITFNSIPAGKLLIAGGC